MIDPNRNVDADVAAGFGREWSRFRQGEQDLTPAEREKIFQDYFGNFPWDRLPPNGGTGIDVGCGSGRWAMVIASRAAHLHLLDASSKAIEVAKDNLRKAENVTFHLASVGAIPLPDRSLDFAYSLGVLHHVPNTEQAIEEIVRVLKPGAPFLVYLYYAFDNRPPWYRWIWRVTDIARRAISGLPHSLQLLVTQLIAASIYWPLARLALLLEMLTKQSPTFPLAWYRDKSFYVMRTDAYDRFCTKLEKRFTKKQISEMLTRSGLQDIRFSQSEPFWCAVGFKV